MAILASLVGAVAVLGFGLGTIAIWSRQRVRLKVTALLLLVGLTATCYALGAQILSRPKPVGLEWFSGAQEAEVLGGRLREGKGIYLWLLLPETEEPRYFVMPWDRSLAEELQQALREAEQNDSGVRMRLPFEDSLDQEEPQFYALPQPALPDKPTPPPPEVYEQPA